jgi:hypothetical protein
MMTGGLIYENGFAVVRKDGKWGVIGKDGNIIIPFEFDDHYSPYMENEMAAIRYLHGSSFAASRDGKWGIIQIMNCDG